MDTQHLPGFISRDRRRYPLATILLVVLSSFALGALPILYGLSASPTPDSEQDGIVVPSEATLWGSLGQSESN